MQHRNAIVTIAIGEKYLQGWKQFCEANWRSYGEKHGYDIICLDKPLDTSARANSRSPSWQKCLILGQKFAQHYDRIVWLDSDVVINTQTAPSIVDHVTIDKVGAVQLYCYSEQAGSIGTEAVKRMYDFWKLPLVNCTAPEYYTNYGFRSGFDLVVQAGVLVLSPGHHREIFEKVYYEYDGREKNGVEWHYEMRPLSHELLKNNLVHWIDQRFNWLWIDSLFMDYPFLLNGARRRNFLGRLSGKIARRLGGLSFDELRDACLRATFLNSYFLHFGGGRLSEMQMLDTSGGSWMNCKI